VKDTSSARVGCFDAKAVKTTASRGKDEPPVLCLDTPPLFGFDFKMTVQLSDGDMVFSMQAPRGFAGSFRAIRQDRKLRFC
jgi:hypothetical protein